MVALALFGLVLGPVAHLPLPVILVAVTAIGGRPALYGIRRRLAHRVGR
ncbi:hypothetical protein ACFYXS_16530 [Streptomyces sp. NPDC002574]